MSDPAVPDAPVPSVTVLTGAGISTGSGIPDFRGPQGVWTRDPLASRLLELDWYLAEPDIRRRAWRMWRDHPVWTAQPTPGHLALVDLERAGALRAVATQNFDGLHQKAGTSGGKVLELHGSLTGTRCLGCGATEPTAGVLARLDTDPDPHCARCGGPLATDVVMFGEPLPADVLDAAVEAAATSDVFVAVGSTLGVQPAASLTAVAADAGARIVIVNAEPTPYDRLADAVLRRPIEDALPELVRDLLAGNA
ncbi:SIR2 family NAD-dependent protein deacylase [Cellulomonas sp. P22]|uniref:SIR2 family NAD-dependent protein deacylase n=1 Tax=Cellulomonas sp. P22 TaxID=3373189 RepID=UPI00379C3668